MEDKYDVTEYIINKYIGKDKDLCYMNVNTTFCLHTDKFYLLCIEPDCTLYLISNISFYGEPEIITIKSKDIKTFNIHTDYILFLLSPFIFSIIMSAIFCLRYKIWSFSIISLFLILFFISSIINNLICMPKYFIIKTKQLKKYKLEYFEFKTSKERSKEMIKIKSRIKKFNINKKTSSL